MHSPGFTALACAVIQRAIDDVFDISLCSENEKTKYTADARNFLLSTHPEHQQAREDWCLIADIEVDVLQRYVRGRLAAVAS